MSRFGLGWQVPSALAGLALGGLLVFFGCARTPPPAAARVTGVVTFEGRPLAGGTVVFIPDPDRTAEGKLHTATADGNGRFVLAEGTAAVRPGWYRVALADPPGSEWGYLFPSELRRPDKSGIEREVKAGHDHHFDFLIELSR
ncbi:MAG: DUF4198 domain-containing protein [Fimbriiglobus sp.]|jgi:hypothetical protein|nr:DUF4198 domain-containing protein [Fimbriiglobus sp.]